MKKWKVLIADGLEASGITVLEQAALVDDLPGISAENLREVIHDYDALIVRSRTKVNDSIFKAGKKLKVVARSGVGVDNIDLNAAKKHQVPVVNSPNGSTIAVAELTFGLILALARKISSADASMKGGMWNKKDLMGVELYGKTLGIIGVGRIGLALAERAVGFGMKVVACDRYVFDEDILRIGIEPLCDTDLYQAADYISLHVPLTNSTRGMIDQHAIAGMKDGVSIVCAARGGIIDESALLDGLNSGKVAGAALDVFSQEPPGKTEIVMHPNVIATPHIGAQTYEAQSKTGFDAATEVLAALENKPLQFRVA